MRFYILFFLLFIFSCSEVVKEEDFGDVTTQQPSIIPAIQVYASNTDIDIKNGILYYKDTPYSGVYIVKFKNDSIKSKSQYLKGKKEGCTNKWYADGKKFEQRYYSNGHKVGVHTGWWNNGAKKFSYHFNDLGQYQGPLTEWYNNGQVFRKFNYVNGRENGAQKAWKANGNIKANYEVVNGERYGLIGLKKCFTVKKGQDKVTR